MDRDQFLTVLDQWRAPPTAWETTLAAELADLEFVAVPKASAAALALLETEPRACHRNCNAVAQEFGKDFRAVVGWLRDPVNDVYLPHSVLGYGALMLCITPTPEVLVDEILFAPDPQITWEDGYAARDGRRIGIVIRADPERIIQEVTLQRHRFLSGETVAGVTTASTQPEPLAAPSKRAKRRERGRASGKKGRHHSSAPAA